MEFANENSYVTQDRINLKNKSPFDVSKKSNKKALSDVGNVIFGKNTQLGSLKSSHLKVNTQFDNQAKDSRSPKRKNVVSKSKDSILESMDENFFTCSCESHVSEDISFSLPESMHLSKQEIDIFATYWGNPKPFEDNVDLDISLEPCNDVLLHDDVDLCMYNDSENSSFVEMLNESLDYVPQLLDAELEDC